MRVPFVVYADFEAFTQKLDDDKPRDNNSSYTSQYEKTFSFRLLLFYQMLVR